MLITDTSCQSLAQSIYQTHNALKIIKIEENCTENGSSNVALVENGNTLCSMEMPYLTKRVSVVAQQPIHAPDDVAFIIFTSGTTGPPRAAALTHSSMHFQCMNKLNFCNYSSNDVYLHTSPLFHVGGLCSALAMLLSSAQHVFMPVFSANTMIQLIQEHKVTAFIAVPTTLTDLVTFLGDTKYQNKELTTVKTVLVGAGATSAQLRLQLALYIPRATLLSTYGMTEACSSITFCTLLRENNSSHDTATRVYVGKAPSGIQLGVLTGDKTPLIQHHGQGEIITRGPHLMLKYWNDDNATSISFLPDGWFRTGDLGMLDSDGSLYLQGRAKDTIKTGGENVAAAEVERTLSQHPAVHAVTVVGMPDERLVERVTAVIVLNKGWAWRGTALYQRTMLQYDTNSVAQSDALNEKQAVDGLEFQMFCRRQGLSGFKLPRAVAVVDALPVNSTGKVVKSQVKLLISRLISDQDEKQTHSVGLRDHPRSRL